MSDCYHCLQNLKNVILLTNLFFTTMVTAAHSNNGRNQLTCIEKDKPKNNNKIRQHEKKQTHLSIPSLLFLVQPVFCSNNHHCDCHRPSIATTAIDACSQPSPPPFLPPLSIIIVIVMIKIIISIHHAATSNALLLPLSPPCCRCISERAAATAKLRFRQTATSAAKLAATTVLLLPPPLPMSGNRCATTAYKINKKEILLTNLFSPRW
jgi:hypothetical protein